MKQITSQLLDFLLSTDVESCYICDLITVTLTSGVVLYITDAQTPIAYLGNTFLPTRWGSWRVNGTKCALGCMNATCDFEVFADLDETMPNWLCSINQAAAQGLFDAATILVETAYMPLWNYIPYGVVIRYGGQITEFTPVGRTTIKGQAKPFTFTLNQPMPRKVLQPSCGWTLYDAGCTVNPAGFTFSNSVGAGTNNTNITAATTITQASGYFTQGVIKMTSGRNTGLSASILIHAVNVLTLSKPFLFPVAIGDTFDIIAGCDHTAFTCQTKFNNFTPGSTPNNFGGQPFIPAKETCI